MLVFRNGIVADYRSIFQNTSFPPSGPSDEFLSENGAYKVNLWLPHNSLTEKLVSCAPYIQDGWAYTVEIEQKTQEEIDADTEVEASKVRSVRNKLLANCDWTQGKDIPDTTSIPWATYRQELRDVPSQAGFPYNVIWPTTPEG